MKSLSRLVDTTYLALLGGRSALYLAGGALLLGIAGWLAYQWIDAGVLLIIAALIGGKGVSFVLRSLEPFAGKRSR